MGKQTSNNIKCNPSLEAHYSTLNQEELKEKKRNQQLIFWMTSLSWMISFSVIVYTTDLELPLLILFGASVIGAIVCGFFYYKRITKRIDLELGKYV